MKRMKRYAPEVQAKYMASFNAEDSNPTLFKEMMSEFLTCWKVCDVNKDGVLKRDEFKVFMEKNNENRKKRFGESVKGDDHEDGQWYDAYNLLC